MEKLKDLMLFPVILTLFDSNTNITTDSGLSSEMKTYYSDYLIDLAEPELVHDQFGQKRPIPQGTGKTVEFRKYDSLPKALTPLTEGVTPNGQKLNMSTITATVNQYGGFVELSDILLLTAIDNNLVEATQLLGSQAGRTLDTITREVMVGGTNVQYAAGQVSSRNALVGGASSGNHYMSVDAVRRAVRFLKTMNAKKIGDSYVGIIHPDVSYDLMNDDAWEKVKDYDPSDWYEGEIGRIAGVRFVETTEAKVVHAEDLASNSRTLLVNGAISSASTSVNFDGGTVASGALVGRYVLIGTNKVKVTANTSSTMTLASAITASDNAFIYPGEAGAAGRDIYDTMVLGANAYGVTELSGGGLQHIVKQLGSAGTADPLDQRATAGWKATKTAVRLVEQYMIRVETASTFASGAN